MQQPSIKILFLIPVFLLLCAIVSLLIPSSVIAAFSGKVAATGSIIVFVEDGATKKPMEGATIAIPETGKIYLTDNNGKTEAIRAPIVEDASYSNILPKPWGEITLLVYKQGYVDCAIFHVNIYENQTRSGPTVLLFPITPNGGDQPFTLTEGPNRIWVNELLKKYNPIGVQ